MDSLTKFLLCIALTAFIVGAVHINEQLNNKKQ